jgi:hypothetical protein
MTKTSDQKAELDETTIHTLVVLDASISKVLIDPVIRFACQLIRSSKQGWLQEVAKETKGQTKHQ